MNELWKYLDEHRDLDVSFFMCDNGLKMSVICTISCGCSQMSGWSWSRFTMDHAVNFESHIIEKVKEIGADLLKKKEGYLSESPDQSTSQG